MISHRHPVSENTVTDILATTQISMVIANRIFEKTIKIIEVILNDLIFMCSHD